MAKNKMDGYFYKAGNSVGDVTPIPVPVDELIRDHFRIKKLSMLYLHWRNLFADPPLLVCAELVGKQEWQIWLFAQHRKIFKGATIESLIDDIPNHVYSEEIGTEIEGLPECICSICTMTPEDEAEAEAMRLRDERRRRAIKEVIVPEGAFDDD